MAEQAASLAASADVVLHNAFVVTMDGALGVLRDGAVAVVGDRIAAVGPSADVLAAFPRAAQTLDLAGRILLPGFVNTHVHTSQQLARGIADDVDLMTWLHGRIWPYESHMTEEDSYATTLLGGIELIRSGRVVRLRQIQFKEEKKLRQHRWLAGYAKYSSSMVFMDTFRVF